VNKQTFQAHPWHGVTPGPRTPELVNAYIEIVPTDAVKYELDKWSGHLRVDRPQRFSSMSPTLYGFIPQTYCGREVAELCATRTGRTGIARPIGGLRMIDGNEADDKIIAVLESDLAYGRILEIRDVPQGLIDRLKHYFLSYKQLPSDTEKKVEIVDVYDRVEAQDVITRSLRDYEEEFAA
jgi:inorganic pyrophosphatase